MATKLNISAIISIILIITMFLSVTIGFRRGLLNTGRWALGIIFGFLAVPIVSPIIEKIIKQTPLYKMFFFGDTGLNMIAARCLQLFIFSLSLVIVKKIVYILTDIELPKGAKVVDNAAGAALGIIKVCLIVWIFEWLLTYNTGYTLAIHRTLMQSSVYALLARHSLLSLL